MAASKLHDLKGLSATEDVGAGVKKRNWGFVQFFFVLSVVLCVLLYASRVFVLAPYGVDMDFFAPDSSQGTSSRSELGPRVGGNAGADDLILDNQVHSPCSTMRNNTICCDRSDFNTDVCFMAGDVRMDAASLSLLLFPPHQPAPNVTAEERVRPYTRKWERFIMEKVQEVRLRVARPDEAAEHWCDVRHDAPVLVMTAGGYTGNFFHAFSDGFLPSWLTVQHLRRRVVLAVLAYNPWWAGTFSEIISGLSDYHVVDLLNDKRTHCFPGAIVGTRFHGILNVDPARLRDNKTAVDFHQLLADVYEAADDRKSQIQKPARRPRLGIVSRKGTRVIENQAAVAQVASSVGFDVDILETANGMPLSAVYASVSACDVLMGVHGADLTKFLFLRPGRAALIQIAPLGVSPIARDCFGGPSARMGLHYEQYDVRGQESSLSRKYALDDVVVADPETAKRDRGWDFVARVYLGGQNVSLDLGRFGETLARLHSRALLLQPQEQPRR
ncbi:xylan glycosyltransferase MUCI21-like [Phragmites australis]|uniref:xylan glycosyltransferase MUCI21-like n=1 Tax=Phragmites australis TaxID=29695 RepID=UPI002D770650|nr:xylan glycosyltransferase MUCI21-like [Phragmites australis]